MDYVEKYGDAAISSIVFVDAGLSRAPGIASAESTQLTRNVSTPALADSIEATRAYIASCFFTQPSPAEFQRMMAYNMTVPPLVRRMMLGRPLDFDVLLRKIRVPTLVMHGERDRLISIAGARYTADAVPGARLILYPEAGHSPFFESAGAFNADLAAFVHSVDKGGTGE